MKGWIVLIARWLPVATAVLIAAAYGCLFATLVVIAVVETPRVAFALGGAFVLGAAGCLLALTSRPPRWLVELAAEGEALRAAVRVAEVAYRSADQRVTAAEARLRAHNHDELCGDCGEVSSP